ncbi:helix-turn-helix domain-containing protein [Novosphingobium huizhouense]|uniref:helix-turn-helix domain-containing protein n=1 Tax=Novosphingobium huizhouense TaxID=2866625 RepID=UPI001CD8C767|nr:helix-turn-helix transcriptional regulator [Novosphingobium huizhouense]
MHAAARKIRSWRKAHNPRLTAAAFGQMVGISPTQAYRIENGALPHGDVMDKIVKMGICAPDDWFAKGDEGREQAA